VSNENFHKPIDKDGKMYGIWILYNLVDQFFGGNVACICYFYIQKVWVT
jgi:hypothetical protein